MVRLQHYIVERQAMGKVIWDDISDEDPDQRWLTKVEREELAQTASDACSLCRLVHKGECW